MQGQSVFSDRTEFARTVTHAVAHANGVVPTNLDGSTGNGDAEELAVLLRNFTSVVGDQRIGRVNVNADM
jgi:hypothetical protein